MTDFDTRKQAAKDAFRDRIVDRLIDLGVSRETALGTVVAHVKFNASLADPIDVLAIHDGLNYLDDPKGHLSLARLLADEHLGLPLHTTRAADPAAAALQHHRRQSSASF